MSEPERLASGINNPTIDIDPDDPALQRGAVLSWFNGRNIHSVTIMRRRRLKDGSVRLWVGDPRSEVKL